MTPEIVYFLKINVAFVLFYGFYRLFFYKDTFFKLRRFILLAFFGLAMVYPLFEFQDWIREQEPMTEMVVLYSSVMPEMTITPDVPAGPDYMLIGTYLYLGIAGCFLLRFLIQLFSILRLRFNSLRTSLQGGPVYLLKKPAGPFSFFRMIFLYLPGLEGKELDEVLTHERTHVRQWHSIDVVLCELINIVFWLNPFVWLLKREVRHNLEYLADDTVILAGYDSKNYQYHLLGLAHNEAAATLYNSFNVLHLKNRISMMNKKRSKGMERTKYLLFLPLIAFLMLFSNVDAVARMTTHLIDGIWSETEGSAVQVDKDAEYPGGEKGLMKYIQMNLRYPVIAIEQEIQGQVLAEYTIDTRGQVTDVKVKKSVDPLLDKEVVRVIKGMEQWTPASDNGTPVAVTKTCPVSFQITGAKTTLKTEPVENEITVLAYAAAGKPQAAKKEKVEVAFLKEVTEGESPQGKQQPLAGAEVMPQFPGGESEMMKFIRDNVKFPEAAAKAGVDGRVVIRFVVDLDGMITNVGIVRSLTPECDQAAQDVVKSMPKWTPGKQNGKIVPVYYTLPVQFRSKKDRASAQTIGQGNTKVKATKVGEVYTGAEVMPMFPGGEEALMKYVRTNLKYPKESAQKGTQGRNVIRFIVQADGSVTNPEIVRELDEACDQESLRLVKSMPKWAPGKQGGKVVPVYYTMPIAFRLQ